MLAQDSARELVRGPRGRFQLRNTSLDPSRCAVDADAVVEMLLVFGAVGDLASAAVARLGAGCDAVTFMTYSGDDVPSTQEQWRALGSPKMDPGQPVGWVEYRRWRPQAHGAPDPTTLTNIEFCIPGAEEVGLFPNGLWNSHGHSAFLEAYIEGAGCDSCGVGGIPVARNNSTPTNPNGLPEDGRDADDQQLIDRVNLHGGHATPNQPSGGNDWYGVLQDFGSI